MSFVAEVIPPACYIFYGMINKGGPELPCMTTIKNESANKNDDNEIIFCGKLYRLSFYYKIMLQLRR